MKYAVLLFVLLMVLGMLFISGCGKTQDSADQTSNEISSDISEIDTLNEELNTSELEYLDQNLDSLEW